jgi:hypothetical protein
MSRTPRADDRHARSASQSGDGDGSGILDRVHLLGIIALSVVWACLCAFGCWALLRPAQVRRRFPVRKSLGWTDPKWLDGYTRIWGVLLVLGVTYSLLFELGMLD